MDFLIEPTPLTGIDRLTFPITLLRGRVIHMPFTLEENFPFTLYFEFVDETGRSRDTKNADREDLVKLLLPVMQEANPTAAEAEHIAAANAQINQLLAGLLVGSKLQRYQAAQLLAGNYQLTLLPLDKQTVIPKLEYPKL